ncbi:transmembrane protein, putative (macronuclear) [Tetrahymena thermophila SB210]|uniref:Transmembrane protein, putative n=1 Tax=Tetrahymena thermophila (strain SB210) TaxID=312017 RepID=W7X289_TETTS|nr:transmembrane protein, putative [Tetrahymena thermophila SB210]EWS73305.1 transmembrane protein, putative [Tetrahymena thermophila SB210]|eukprot:XP_012654154.1 transmembrane protein, putative [Tetrahymena thermophila SB210]
MARFLCFAAILVLGILGGLAANIVYKLGVFSNPIETQGYSCKLLEKQGVHTKGPEDILIYNSTYLITTSNDNFQMWEVGQYTDALDGAINLVKNYKTNPEIVSLKILNFPKSVRFHPHGAYIRKQDDTLFVVNHSYSSGNGDRVEVFALNIEEKTLIYKNSIQLPSYFTGVANNLVVTSKGTMYITKYIATEDPLSGRQNKPFLLQLEYIYHVLFLVHKTNAYKCTFEENWTSKNPLSTNCVAQLQTNSIMANGITWDGKDTLYLADTTNKFVKRYKITDNQLEQTGQVMLSFAGDNIEYDPETGYLYSAGPTKPINHITYAEKGKKAGKEVYGADEFWCGVGYVDTKTFTFKEVAQLKSSVIGCSSAYVSNNKLIIGSWTEKALVECNKQ